MTVKFEGKVAQSVRKWALANADKVYEICYMGGFCFDGRGDMGYDVGVRNGWSTDEGLHTIIEPTARDTLIKLRELSPCDCDQCKENT